jgi:mannosyl-glycoprotein endo-beta-N-acetylglucosaminidase
MAQYLLTIDFQGTGRSAKALRDIFVGIDVWGRGQHGGGKLTSYKALTHIDPEFLGLSAAVFGPGWSWESEQDNPGWNWDVWWAYERLLWVGPPDPADAPDVEDPHPPGHDNSQCDHGPYKPLTSFFQREPPPNPMKHAFFTTFSPGVGHAWFIEGAKVWEADGMGWTDLDKNCSLGDLLWPRPTLDWHKSERSEELPTALPSLDMQNAWMGGNSLCLKLSVAGSNADDAFFRCFWIPVQSLAITPELPYIVKLVYKDSFSDSNIEGDVGLSVRVLGDKVEGEMEITPVTDECGDLTNGWRQLSVKIVAPPGAPFDVHCAVGMILGFASEDPTVPVELVLTLGSLAAYPVAPVATAQTFPKVIWAAFKPSPPPSISGKTARFSGVLTWEVGEYFGPLTSLTLVGPEDPKPAWPQGSRVPGFLYFNVYVLPHHSAPGIALKPEDAVFIGTTGLDGRANRFYIDSACLPSGFENIRTARFYVQGVTDRGVVLSWQDCVFVDVAA